MSPVSRPRYSGPFASMPNRSAPSVIRAMADRSMISGQQDDHPLRVHRWRSYLDPTVPGKRNSLDADLYEAFLDRQPFFR